MDAKERVRLTKIAHRQATIRLAEEYPFEVEVNRLAIRKEEPGLSHELSWHRARSILREQFRSRFLELYNEEKVKAGLPEKLRHYRELAEEAILLYDHGKGLSMKQIAEILPVSYSFVNKAIRATGLIPPIGRRKNNA